MKITRTCLGEILKLAKEGSPKEVCGVLCGGYEPGVEGNCLVSYVIACNNTHIDPEHAFSISASDLRNVFRFTDQRYDMVVGLYHSHPFGPAIPSEADKALSRDTGMDLLIVTLLSNDFRLWHTHYNGAEPECVEIELERSSTDDSIVTA